MVGKGLINLNSLHVSGWGVVRLYDNALLPMPYVAGDGMNHYG